MKSSTASRPRKYIVRSQAVLLAEFVETQHGGTFQYSQTCGWTRRVWPRKRSTLPDIRIQLEAGNLSGWAVEIPFLNCRCCTGVVQTNQKAPGRSIRARHWSSHPFGRLIARQRLRKPSRHTHCPTPGMIVLPSVLSGKLNGKRQ